MRLETLPFGPPLDVHHSSDIESLTFSAKRLVVRVARELTSDGKVLGLELTFDDAFAFRYLDEADLARYWGSEGFVRGYPVLEVVRGGWSDEEAVLQGFEQRNREWLVVTGNGCVSVFATTDPTSVEVTWPFEG